MEPYTIVLHGNLKEGESILVDGVLKRAISFQEYDKLRWKKWELDKVTHSGVLYRFKVIMDSYESLEHAIVKARQLWKEEKWHNCRKHLMIKQEGIIIFEHE